MYVGIEETEIIVHIKDKVAVGLMMARVVMRNVYREDR